MVNFKMIIIKNNCTKIPNKCLSRKREHDSGCCQASFICGNELDIICICDHASVVQSSPDLYCNCERIIENAGHCCIFQGYKAHFCSIPLKEGRMYILSVSHDLTLFNISGA